MRPNLRHTTTLAVTALVALALVGCGDDTVEPVAEPTGTTTPATDPTTDPTTVPDGSGYEHPTGADDVVVSIEQQGGFVPAQFMFSRLPTLLVSGDGRQFSPGPQIAIYPAPLLPNVQVAEIGEDGIQELLALADEHGLLQEREYPSPANIADAPDTVVTIRVGEQVFVHRAYALGLDGGLDDAGAPIDDEDRRELAAFVDAAGGAVPADTASFEPERYLVRATPVDDLDAYELDPTVVTWPVDVDVDLASAECVELAAEAVGSLFAEANELTFFEQDGTIFQLAVKPQLPGSSC